MTTLLNDVSTVGVLQVVPFAHPQGCRSYLVTDPDSREALVLDPHLDLVDRIADAVGQQQLNLRYIVDSHTHADHPSGAQSLADRFTDAKRAAHEASSHAGVSLHPGDGDVLHLGSERVIFRHTPGHTPDHLMLLIDGALFSGDSLLIGAVARTDFLGGDAGQLFDSIHTILGELGDDVLLFPGHDYAGRVQSRIGEERANNPWLKITQRDEFVRALTANPPPRPANMGDLLRFNREGTGMPERISVDAVKKSIAAGGARSVLDVRTDVEFAEQRIEGAKHIPLDQLGGRLDEVRALPAPRLILCRSGKRAVTAQETLKGAGIGGTSIIDGGILAYSAAGGDTIADRSVMSLERQVRIAAGLLVLVGVLLGFFVHPWFVWLAGFVGAGLVFAGVTDQCGMALLLAKLPWNQKATPDAPAGGGGCAATPPAAGGCAATAPATGGGCAATPPTVDS